MEEQVLSRFLDCGDLHQGFARIYCADCGHDYLLAFSCKARYFCPSCHQKRMLAYGDWVEEHILAPVTTCPRKRVNSNRHFFNFEIGSNIFFYHWLI